MSAAFDPAGPPAYNKRRQRTVSVAIAVADGASIKQDHVIQQRPVTVRRRSQFLHVISEQPDMIGLDFCALLHLLRKILVMGQRMMRLGNADLRIRPTVLFAAI